MKLLTFILVLISAPSFGKLPSGTLDYLKYKWKLNETEKKYLEKGEILANADVADHNQKQVFQMQATGLHTKKCRKVLRKLSLFENYPEWISFVKKLTYNDESHLLTMHADHPLLPFPMIVHIIVKRPTKTGKYSFVFPTGIFKGLKGYYEIKEFDQQCFFYAESFWQGAKTKIPSMVIELFSETLAKIGGEVLMRKTK